jgi:hypothetical protein
LARAFSEDIVAENFSNASHVWGEAFTPTDLDIVFISNLLLEEGVPMDSRSLAFAVVRERLQSEARRRARLEADDKIYLPRNRFQVGEQLVFPALDFARAKVLSIRPGSNAELGEFEVIRVSLDGSEREFAAGLAQHRLNDIPLEAQVEGGDLTPEQIVEQYGGHILPALEQRLGAQDDIAKIAGCWFPRALMVDISPGELNLAEAVLDVAGGGPLPTPALLEHVNIPPNVDPRLAAFSLEHAMYQDERFDEVGPSGEMVWFLQRLEPPEVTFPPRRLACTVPDAGQPLPDFLEALELDLQDEWSAAAGPVEEEACETSLVLPFPHWRVGALPLNPVLAEIFPSAHQAVHIRFDFIDSENNERFPGWVVTPGRYVFGLADWYEKKGMIAGGLLRVRKGKTPGEVILEAATRRPIREWVRTASATSNNRLSYTMQKQAIAVEYDEQSVIAVADPQQVDEVWLRLEEARAPLRGLVADVFRELAKLNPQSTVHARTLYHAVNVVRRSPPAPIFAELARQPYYVHVGDLYYRFEEDQWMENR